MLSTVQFRRGAVQPLRKPFAKFSRSSISIYGRPAPGSTRMNDDNVRHVPVAPPRPVAQLMSADVLTVNPEDELSDAIGLLLEHEIGATPVVEPGSKKLVGIVSYVDASRAARDLA